MKTNQKNLIQKRLFSVLLVFSLLITTFSFSVSAATPQKAMFLFKNKLYVSCNVASHSASSSYPYRKPIDIIDNVSGNGNAYAPFDCKVVAKATSEGNTIAIESLEKVEFADGTVDYMTIMVAHDDNISNISIGKTFKQGEVFYQEGNAGTSSGSHIHLETAKGAYSKRSKSSQSIWSFVRDQSNVVYPHNALFLYENTTISKSGGYTWKYATTEKNYTITYNANGGSGAPSPQTYSGDWVTISSTVPYRAGYTFNGWLTTATPGTVNVSYSPGTLQPSMGNETLYANWKANTLTVHYNVNGGATHSDWYKIVSGMLYKQSDSTVYSQTWTYNDTQANGLSNAVTLGLYKVGYSFVGWSTTSTGETLLDQDDVSLTPTDITPLIKKGDCEITLYAIWRPNTMNVHYHANGGKITSDSYNINSGLIYNTSDSSKVCQTWVYNAPHSHGLKNIKTFGLTKEGYTFIGWGTTSSGETILDQNNHDLLPTDISSTIKKGDCEITLYAIWQKNVVTPPAVIELPRIKIKQTSTEIINYGEILVLTLEEIEIPDGYTVAWFVDGVGIATTVLESGAECRVTSVANGNPTISVKLVDENNNPIKNNENEEILDEITITSRAGFFQKLISFFKNLFGINRLIY